MSSISIFSGSFCRAESVVDNLVARTRYQLVSDEDIVLEASRLSGLEACPGSVPSVWLTEGPTGVKRRPISA